MISDDSPSKSAPPLSALETPFSPNYVAAPLVVYGRLPLTSDEWGRDDDENWDGDDDDGGWVTGIYFDTAECLEPGGPGDLGRLTFERLDAIKVTSGEYLPYEREPSETGRWAYVMSESPWLDERHQYDLHHYGRSLRDTYRHYVFVFHDEFIEAIGEGIRLDRVDRDALFARPSSTR
ncbi:hypothetical protein [Streptomyces sp. NPDC007883]|uniref:hypothetical protein n=1 Tax=Streptomyces sp. NPDC007883 TaxID=3155116 RepID=UPI0033DADA3A